MAYCWHSVKIRARGRLRLPPSACPTHGILPGISPDTKNASSYATPTYARCFAIRGCHVYATRTTAGRASRTRSGCHAGACPTHGIPPGISANTRMPSAYAIPTYARCYATQECHVYATHTTTRRASRTRTGCHVGAYPTHGIPPGISPNTRMPSAMPPYLCHVFAT